MNTDKIFAEAIANEYAPKDTSKVVALRKLDRKAKGPANIFAYSFGVLMTLVLGLGMCLSMQVIGGGGVLMTGAGILLGILGLVGVGLNYPVYKKLLRSQRKSMPLNHAAGREISESQVNQEEGGRMNKSESKYFNTALRDGRGAPGSAGGEGPGIYHVKEICRQAA
jgi:hypothetical protein